MKRKEENTQKLISFGNELKKQGLNVYIHNEKYNNDTYQSIYHRQWIFVSNGKNILTISFDNFGYWNCSFEYIPNSENGGGCQLLQRDTIELTVDMVMKFLSIENVLQLTAYNKCIKPKYITFYKDEKDWFNKLWAKERYELL